MTRDDRHASGGEPAGSQVGHAGSPAVTLPPSELADLLDRTLAAGERMIALISERHMDHAARGADSPVRDVAYQLFRQSLAFADAMDTGRLHAEWLRATTPDDFGDGAAVARYGALVRARLGGWFEGAGPAEYARTIETDRGPERGHELLDRTARQATRQLRYLRALLEDLGLRSDELPPASLP